MKKKYLALILGAMMVLLAACGEGTTGNTKPETTNVEKPANDSQTTSSTIEEENAEETTNEPTEDVLAEPEEKAHKVGDTFELGDWEVVLESFEFDQKVSSDMFSSSADEGSKFIVLNFAVTNNGKEADHFTNMFGGVNIKAMFKDDYEFKASITMLENDLSFSSIKPLSTKKGFVVIEVPDSVVESTDSLVLHLEHEKNKAQLDLR